MEGILMVFNTAFGLFISGFLWHLYSQPTSKRFLMNPRYFQRNYGIVQMLVYTALMTASIKLAWGNYILLPLVGLHGYFLYQGKYHPRITLEQNDMRLLLMVCNLLLIVSVLLSISLYRME